MEKHAKGHMRIDVTVTIQPHYNVFCQFYLDVRSSPCQEPLCIESPSHSVRTKKFFWPSVFEGYPGQAGLGRSLSRELLKDSPPALVQLFTHSQGTCPSAVALHRQD